MRAPSVLNVGFYNYVLTDKVVALVSSESAPMRRLVQTLRKDSQVIDATHGRRTKSIIFTTGPAVVLSAISQETLAKRLTSGEIAADLTVADESALADLADSDESTEMDSETPAP
jgi:regulator of extracellular matrix RemA (YlzA/DUF370 family)